MNNYSSSDEASMDGDVSDWSDVSEEAGDLLTQADQEEVAIHPGRPKKQKVTVNPPIPIELIPSRKRMKNGDISFLAILEGEIYKRSEQPNAEGIQQWRCIKHCEGCKMVIDTNRADLCVGKSKTRHSHCTAKVDLDIRAINARVPILATQNQAAPRQIYSSIIENTSRKVAARINPLNIAHVINYHRNKMDADPTTSTNPVDMVIPVMLQNYKNDLFVLYDSGPSARRIMIFSTPALLDFLQNAEWWGFDGTFALVPKGWIQLLTLHAKLGETFVPCLHALLPKKSRRTYDHFFSAVKQLIPNSRVRHAHMDFERTLISAFEHAYNLAEKHGCFAHFARALYRKVGKLGLVRKYKLGEDFTNLFDMLKSIAYVPINDVSSAYDAVMTQCARNSDGTEKFVHGSCERRFIDYFVKTWIGQDGARSMFPISLWNCFALTLDGKSKTTNSLEAWHNSLKLALATADGKRPRFWRWLRQMKQECSLMEAQIVLLQGTPKKLKLVDQRIARQRLNIALAYNREEILEYLRKQSDFTVLDQF